MDGSARENASVGESENDWESVRRMGGAGDGSGWGGSLGTRERGGGNHHASRSCSNKELSHSAILLST